MASIRITINTDGAAFRKGDAYPTLVSWELAHVLGRLANQLHSVAIETLVSEPLRDRTGKPCGTVEVIE
jgi:hypothetical protein